MTTATSINYPEWLRQGAVYGFKEKLHLYWGDAAQSKTPLSYPAIYSNDFFLNNSAPWSHFAQTITTGSQPFEQAAPEALVWEAPDHAQFAAHFKESMRLFADGTLKKIVLATESRARKTQSPETLLRSAIGAIPPNTHLYGKWNSTSGFIGFTPEVLFEIEDRELKTMALAGTSSVADAIAVLHSKKNQEEHQWVIADIGEVLSPFGKVHVGSTEILELASLSHLMTPISVDLKSTINIHELISALHPTPALGTSPRSQISRLEEWRHGYDSFGAPFAVVSEANRAIGLVGIRQLAWDEEYYYIRCGCGVVKDSRLEEEWQELLLKIRSVKKLFGWNET